MNELAQAVLENQYVGYLILASFILTHVLPQLPPSLTAKVPDWVMKVLNFLAGQYKYAENKQTDMSGNPKK